MSDHASTLERGRDFIRREARLLEQRLFATLFEGAPASGVLAALRGFRNDDGGFGHGLEPDKLCPDSLPIDVEIALGVLDAVADGHDEMARGACDYLATVSVDGAVALASPVIERYPHAVHWSEWTYQPGLNPTAGLAGLLHKLGVDHPWRKDATAWCWDALTQGLPGEAHALAGVLMFLEHVDDRQRAQDMAATVRDHLPAVTMLRLDAQDPEYGVSPLHYAPDPSSPWRDLFADATIDAHLDVLLADQQHDGGWPLRWEPPSTAATMAYRGMETLRALRALTAYGRVAAGP